MKLTHELIHAAKTPKGGWTKAQLAVIGVDWPPANGWRHGVVGKEIPDADYQRFCELASARAKQNVDRENLPAEQLTVMDAATVIAWITDKMEIEKMERMELAKEIGVLQFQLNALRKELEEARRSLTDHDCAPTPTLPQKTPATPPWKV